MTDDALVEFAGEFRSGILNGRPSWLMCFAVCYPLSGLLRLHGVNTELVEGSVEIEPGRDCNHFWLRLDDGRVLDPTADQFDWLDMPPVYLGPPSEIHGTTP